MPLTPEQIQALKDSYPYLDSTKSVSKNVKLMLKKIFPNTKFSVIHRSFSGGDSVDVRWKDGPTSAMVDRYIDLFCNRDFDGMTDSSTYRHNPFNEVFGGASFVSGYREMTPNGIVQAWHRSGGNIHEISFVRDHFGYDNLDRTKITTEKAEAIIKVWRDTDFS